MRGVSVIISGWILLAGCARHTGSNDAELDTVAVDTGMVNFVPFQGNPVFNGTGDSTWDEHIRERGFILHEGDEYHLWYTGYREGEGEAMHLGYATSPDGITWTRYKNNPIIDSGWVEDVMVVKRDTVYYMFAEGEGDIAHMLTSADRIHWKEQGKLDIRYTNGKALSPGPYGTPTAWYEGETWYLMYERGDLGIWLATSTDLKVWTNKQDDPVIKPVPEPYDKYGVAVNQVIEHQGKYYAYYHATAYKDWHEWSSCVATSNDLIYWKKYEKNPILKENKSSPILIEIDGHYRLYTMHPAVALHRPFDDLLN
jgi:predicted GH43/DUF377 family glycosyl hydrolase